MAEDINYKNLITRKHLSVLVGIDPQTIHRWEKQGMPVIHIGIGKIPRYDYEKALDWMQKMEKTGGENK